MTDVGPEKGTQASEKDPTAAPSEKDTPSEKDDVETLRAEAAHWRAQTDKWEKRAKSNQDAAKELDRLRREEMPAQERAIADAVEAARADVGRELAERYGARLVHAEIRAAAADRLAAEQLDALTEAIRVQAFLDADGDVDRDAVRRFVDGVAPKPPDATPAPADQLGAYAFPDLGQGARVNGNALNGDPLLADIKRHLGIR